MAIRPTAEEIYFNSHPDERELARRLDEAFEVTYGDQHRRLSFWLADPKSGTTERFGLNREILVIYSRHARTDARVLTTADDIMRRPEFRHRLDKGMFLLVHHGDETETDELIKSQVDWIIVPMRADELLAPGRGNLFIRSRIATSLSQVDLFGMSSPITSDKYFFGRQDLVQNLTTRVTARHENAGLFGLRKTGKTSVLRGRCKTSGAWHHPFP